MAHSFGTFWLCSKTEIMVVIISLLRDIKTHHNFPSLFEPSAGGGTAEKLSPFST